MVLCIQAVLFIFYSPNLVCFLVLQLKAFYFSIIRRIKDSFDWPGEIVSENDNAWIGEVPLYLRRKADFDSSSSDVSSSPTPNESFEDIKESAQDISSYQVTSVPAFCILFLFGLYHRPLLADCAFS